MLFNFISMFVRLLSRVGIRAYTNFLLMLNILWFYLKTLLLSINLLILKVFTKIYFFILKIIVNIRSLFKFIKALKILNLLLKLRRMIRLKAYLRKWRIAFKGWIKSRYISKTTDFKFFNKDKIRYNLLILRSYIIKLKVSSSISIFFDRNYKRSFKLHKIFFLIKEIFVYPINSSHLDKGKVLNLSTPLVMKLSTIYLHLDNSKLTKRLVSSNKKYLLESNPLYVSYYFPYTYHALDEKKGIFTSMDYTFIDDVLPYGDVLDFDMYYEFNNKLPFPYAEAGWDLSLASRHMIFKYWLRWYGWLGVRFKPTKAMTNFAIIDLHMQCRKLQDRIMNEEGIFFIFNDRDDCIQEANESWIYNKTPDIEEKSSILIKDKKTLLSLFDDQMFAKFTYWNPYNGNNVRLVRYWNQDALALTLIAGFVTLLCVLVYSYYYLSFYMGHMHYASVYNIYPYQTSYNKANAFNHYKVYRTYWPFIYNSKPFIFTSPYEWFLFERSQKDTFGVIFHIYTDLLVPSFVRTALKLHMPPRPILFNDFISMVKPSTYALFFQNYYASYKFIDSGKLIEEMINPSYIELFYDFVLIKLVLIKNFLLYWKDFILTIVMMIFIYFTLLLSFFRFSGFRLKKGETYYLALSPTCNSIFYNLNYFLKQSIYKRNSFNRLVNKLRIKKTSSQLLLSRFDALVPSNKNYYDSWLFPTIVDFSTFKHQFTFYPVNFPFIKEFKYLNDKGYNTWSNWYDYDLDRQFSENSIYMTEEADEEYDEMEDIGTDLYWRYEYYSKEDSYTINAPLYSPYFDRLDWYYFKLLAYPNFCLTDDFVVKDNSYTLVLKQVVTFSNGINYLLYMKNDPLIFSRFFYVYDKQFTWHNPIIDRERELSFNLMRRNIKLQGYDNYKLFYATQAVNSYFYFPLDRWIETEDLLLSFTDYEFYKRLSFSTSLLKMRYYKTWQMLNYSMGISRVRYMYMLKTSRIRTITDVQDDFVNKVTNTLSEVNVEVENFFDLEVDTYLNNTLTYEFASQYSLDRDFEIGLLSWYENPVSIRAGYFTNLKLYTSAFWWYFKDELYQDEEGAGLRETLRFTLNDLYWAENQMNTWLPVVITESISSQYLRFSNSVLLFTYLFNQFEEYKLNSVTNSDDILMPSVFAIKRYRRHFPGYGLYFDRKHLKYMGAWPYGLDILDVEDGLTIKRLTSIDNGSNPFLEMDEQNFSRAFIADFRGLTFEQRIHLLIDHRKRMWMRYYDIIDTMFMQNTDIELNDDYLGNLWLGQHVIWFTTPDSYLGYDSWF